MLLHENELQEATRGLAQDHNASSASPASIQHLCSTQEGSTVGMKLCSTNISLPFHILCKSHTYQYNSPENLIPSQGLARTQLEPVNRNKNKSPENVTISLSPEQCFESSHISIRGKTWEAVHCSHGLPSPHGMETCPGIRTLLSTHTCLHLTPFLSSRKE